MQQNTTKCRTLPKELDELLKFVEHTIEIGREADRDLGGVHSMDDAEVNAALEEAGVSVRRLTEVCDSVPKTVT